MDADRQGLIVLDEAACRALLHTVHLGRVALTDGALPMILPVTFACLDRDLVFRAGPGALQRAARLVRWCASKPTGSTSGSPRAGAFRRSVISRAVTDPAHVERCHAAALPTWSNAATPKASRTQRVRRPDPRTVQRAATVGARDDRRRLGCSPSGRASGVERLPVDSDRTVDRHPDEPPATDRLDVEDQPQVSFAPGQRLGVGEVLLASGPVEPAPDDDTPRRPMVGTDLIDLERRRAPRSGPVSAVGEVRNTIRSAVLGLTSR